MNSTEQYLETQVLTAPPEQLHMLVVDGAVRFARLGLQSLNEQNYEQSHEALSRSREFVNELIIGVQDEGNPELANQLRGLFGFVYRNLVDADGQREAQKAEDAIKILEQHRQTWAELCDRLKQEQAGAAPAPHHQAAYNDDEETGRSWTT